MPRTKGQNEQIRAERRRTILLAAVPLFTANGLSQTSMSKIAEAAGVSHGTVFLYFPTKEDLFRAALMESPGVVLEHFSMTRYAEGSPLERIRRMVREQLRSFHRHESYLRLTQYVLGQRERFPELSEFLFAFAKRFTEDLMLVIREGQDLGELEPGDPAAIAWSYFSYVNGVGLIVFGADEEFQEQLMTNGIRIFGPRKP